MNEEKKIAQAILDAQKMREESYKGLNGTHDEYVHGEYKRSMEDCLIEACEKQGLSSNLWALLSLAMHWYNDIQLWSEDVLAGRDVINQVMTPDELQKEKEELKR